MEERKDNKISDFVRKLEFNESIIGATKINKKRQEAFLVIAHDLKTHYDSLISQGFSKEQSLELTKNYQSILWNISSRN